MKEIRLIEGTGISIRGRDIDTDRIIPARFLKEISFARMGEYPFYDERFTPEGDSKIHPLNEPARRGATLLVAGENFGCGSSREHAPQALYRWGIRAIVAESLAEIFGGNCIQIGLPAVTLGPHEIGRLREAVEADPELELRLDLETRRLRCGEEEFRIEIPEPRRLALVSGQWDSTALLLSRMKETRRTVEALPYIRGFS